MAAPPQDDDIDAWVEQLAGRASDTPAETRVLREAVAAVAMRGQAPGSAVPPGAQEDHALQRMLFRLKQEGLLKRPLAPWKLWLPAAATAMLLAVVGFNLYSPGAPGVEYAVAYEEPPRYRGAVAELQVPGARPLASVLALAGALGKLGARPKLYAWQGQAVLDFEVPAGSLDNIRKLLAAHQLPAQSLPKLPNAGLHRLVFQAR